MLWVVERICQQSRNIEKLRAYRHTAREQRDSSGEGLPRPGARHTLGVATNAISGMLSSGRGGSIRHPSSFENSQVSFEDRVTFSSIRFSAPGVEETVLPSRVN